MFFLLDAKITILYLFSMQKLVESLYKSVPMVRFLKKIILNVAKKTENELISCNIQNDKS